MDTLRGYMDLVELCLDTYDHHSAVERVMHYTHSNIHEPENNYTGRRKSD